MLSDRPYSPPSAVSEALAELRRGAGSQFDAAVVEAFAVVLEAKSLGLTR
jgi:HD-GYP domain-containing protein (c-di-GMP phosphodiesterase class II)